MRGGGGSLLGSWVLGFRVWVSLVCGRWDRLRAGCTDGGSLFSAEGSGEASLARVRHAFAAAQVEARQRRRKPTLIACCYTGGRNKLASLLLLLAADGGVYEGEILEQKRDQFQAEVAFDLRSSPPDAMFHGLDPELPLDHTP